MPIFPVNQEKRKLYAMGHSTALKTCLNGQDFAVFCHHYSNPYFRGGFVQFVLNEKCVNETCLPADLTLLRYLREHQHHCATKEGCASGDCGACTVLLGSLHDHDGTISIVYQSVNTCITPVAVAHGKHVVTLEHLGSKGALHPAQQAMVDYHGSQCGFCTPGFVMSLAGLYHSLETKADRNTVCQSISGNLCRCTGYRPIVDAGLAMHSYPKADKLYTNYTLSTLKNISSSEQSTKGYWQPASLTALNTALRIQPGAKLIAGGTDLVLEVTQSYQSFNALIDVSNVKEMKLIEKRGDMLVLGAALTYSELETELESLFPELCKLLLRLGSPQIRHRGTLGGNIGNASPIGDMPPILLSMDAEVEIGASNSEPRTVKLNDFYLDYKKTVLKTNDYIISIRFPLQNLKDFHRFYKISKRVEDDISSVMGAIRLRTAKGKITEVRIAFGGVAATPVRVVNAENALTGENIHSRTAIDKAIKLVRAELKPLSDVRASDEYRREMAGNIVLKCWLEMQGEDITDLTYEGFVHYA